MDVYGRPVAGGLDEQHVPDGVRVHDVPPFAAGVRHKDRAVVVAVDAQPDLAVGADPEGKELLAARAAEMGDLGAGARGRQREEPPKYGASFLTSSPRVNA
ncbi:hypothetical protein [Nonomuraea sp. SYSU D8015]|uniref:hypothetical protein n=1 Tax=Nonomuraea sp. SYSU D8015 TaxID=2593644 RepID=UPI001660E200|nr:hypothetical protein [Nonomuraea sp. SYSU D8015]